MMTMSQSAEQSTWSHTVMTGHGIYTTVCVYRNDNNSSDMYHGRLYNYTVYIPSCVNRHGSLICLS